MAHNGIRAVVGFTPAGGNSFVLRAEPPFSPVGVGVYLCLLVIVATWNMIYLFSCLLADITFDGT